MQVQVKSPLHFFCYKTAKNNCSLIHVLGLQNALRASYLLSYRIARKGIPHTSAEDVCLPAAKEMVECMLGGREKQKNVDIFLLSNNTVSRRIDTLSEDILATLVSRVKKSEFYSPQVDESTDVANLANLLVYVRCLFEGMVQEDFFVLSAPFYPNNRSINLQFNRHLFEHQWDRLDKLRGNLH